MSRPKIHNISLSDPDVKKLKSFIRKKSTSKTLRNRCQVLLDLDEAHGKVLTHEQCSKSNGISLSTVQNTVNLYTAEGLDGVCSLKWNCQYWFSKKAQKKFVKIGWQGLSEVAVVSVENVVNSRSCTCFHIQNHAACRASQKAWRYTRGGQPPFVL